MVGPHCVQEPEGMPPAMPAFVQSVARLGSSTPDQSCCWPADHAGTINEIPSRQTTNHCFRGNCPPRDLRLATSNVMAPTDRLNSRKFIASGPQVHSTSRGRTLTSGQPL